MRRLAKKMILCTLIFTVVLGADFSSASNCGDNYIKEKKFFTISQQNNSHDNDSAFWSKFRESVMPDDNDKGKIPNYEKHPDPPPQHDNHQPPPHR